MTTLHTGASAAAITAWLMGGGGEPPVPPDNFDEHWWAVILLMQWENADEVENLAASGYTLNGTAGTINAGDSPFNDHSWSPTAGGIVGDDRTQWQMGGSDWTMEFWYFDSSVGTKEASLIDLWDYNFFARSSYIVRLADGKLSGGIATDDRHYVDDDEAFPESQWVHCCWERDGANYRLYKNGVMVGKFVGAAADIVQDSSFITEFGICAQGDAPGATAKLDNIRITRGVARYASDAGFTPPDAPFASDGDDNAPQLLAFRDWRLLFNGNHGDADFTQAARIEMYKGARHVDLCNGAAVSASSFFNPLTISRAFDEDYTDEWVSAEGSGIPSWVRMIFPEPARVREIHIRQPTGSLDRAPADIDVQFSPDGGTTWVTKWNIDDSANAWAEREGRFFRNPAYTPGHVGSPHGAHRYWAVLCLVNEGSNHSLAELEIRAVPAGADQTGTGTAISSADFGSGFVKAAAFDNDNSSAWAAGTDWAWIGYDFGDGNDVECAQVAITSRNADNTQTLSRGAVLFSDDGANWNCAWEISSPSSWGVTETRTFSDPEYIAGGAGDWAVSYEAEGGSTFSSGSNGKTWRVVIPDASLDEAGEECRVTFRAGADQCVIAEAFIGEGALTGDVWDFASAPTRLTFSGEDDVTISATQAAVSDAASFAIAGDAPIIVSFYLQSGGQARFFLRQSTAHVGASTAGNHADDLDSSIFSSSNFIVAVEKIETRFVA